MLGDKEIAVKIRGNSHYRNSRPSGQVGMLIALRPVKVSWANGEAAVLGQRISLLAFGYEGYVRTLRGAFIFISLKKKERNFKMKKTIRNLLLTVIALAITLFAVACNNSDPWASATYLENTELGTGAVTFTLEVKAEDKTVVFTINTDKEILSDALLEVDLIKGEDSTYGLYLTHVNGMIADYDTDGTYWAIYENGEYAMTGIDGIVIASGATYTLERAKG